MRLISTREYSTRLRDYLQVVHFHALNVVLMSRKNVLLTSSFVVRIEMYRATLVKRSKMFVNSIASHLVIANTREYVQYIQM